MKITKYLIGGLAALALVGCKDKMRELNTNPDTIGKTDPRYMFMNAMQDFDNPSRGFVANNAQTAGSQMQYFVYYTGAQDGRYCDKQAMNYTTLGTISYYYDWYKSVGYKMVSLQNYIDDNLSATDALKYQDLKAICGIVKIYEAFRVFQNYGAAVYSEAFDAITEGITLPKYDIFNNEVYESMDDELAAWIAVLEAPANENTAQLGVYDPVYGYTPNAGMGAPNTRDNYTQQRELWKKFANSYRLYMAWIMKDVDQARFTKVLAETQTSGWYESAEDGAYTYMNGYSENGGIYNCAEAADISTLYSVSDNFVSYLKELSDPRLPLLARANNLYDANNAMKWMQAYYPDSLANHWYYNSTTQNWESLSWNGVLDFDADPLLAYQGQSANPNDYDRSGPQHFWGASTFTFRFYHPDYEPGNTEHNDNLGPWTVTNKGTTSEKFPASYTVYNADTSFTIELGSRPQGRYFVPGGGAQYGAYDGQARNGFDGSVEDRPNIFMRHPLYTYPEFCFLMAYLTQTGETTGKSADAWYEDGVKAAMKELQADAIRYGVQVATNTEHTYYTEATGTRYVNPEIKGINDNGVYSISENMIANYVANNALGSATDKIEAISGQMWIYCYKQPAKMWDWWRKTGYPEIKEVTSPANRPSGLYWVKPTAQGDGNQLEWPRRAALPQPEAINNANYNAAREVLLGTPNYGSTYNENTGRIYWDKQGL